MQTISRLLIANRAEIASRIVRTCRKLGIETVAVYSDADAGLPFVREADAAVRLPGSTPADTYLRADLVLEAAQRTGADAVHPGYGFLSENADFARAVIEAGLLWVGPDPSSIEQMGSKVEAKKLMEAAGVPVLGNLGVDTATEADLPLLVKASAGGGGRGMRTVTRLDELEEHITAARQEAESAFGDGTVFVEPYVERSRHVEVQVVGHRDGVLVLGERDCSIQRRHQKVLEETPAPDIAAEVVEAMHAAARAAAEAIGYLGAGTVEFLYDPESEHFFFLEMNTRLQVEHPVTELVHGVDLVELQLAVAEGAEGSGVRGRGSSLSRPPQPPEGHAIEARLYAEDPAHDWHPQSGTLVTFEVPDESGIRVDAGFVSGSEVSTHYDAMLAKVIAHAPTRHEAARKLAGALARSRIHGVTTNRDLLVSTLRDPAFLAGQVSTDFFERRSLLPTTAVGDPDPHLLFAAAVALAERAREARLVQHGIPVGWRNVRSQPHRTTFVPGERDHVEECVEERAEEWVVEWYVDRDGYRSADGALRVVSASPGAVTVEADLISACFDVEVADQDVYVDGPLGAVHLRVVPRFVDPATAVASGSLLAPMPGTVVSVAVEAGAEVAAGEPVLVLEAMKMQHTVNAPRAGVVTEIDVQPGAQVAAGDVLAVVSTGSTTDEESATTDEESATNDENEERP